VGLQILCGVYPEEAAEGVVYETPSSPRADFHALARQKECQMIEGHVLLDHVHMCIAIPPKHPLASVIGFLEGKSAIALAELCGKERNFRASISGPAGMPCPRSDLSCSKSASTSANEKPRIGTDGPF
jgi:hypothetical protein